MRAKTKGKHEIRKRFAIVIGVAAVGVMALGAQTVMAQTAAQPPAVVKYDTNLTITHEAVCSGELPKPTAHGRADACPKGTALWHGGLGSEVRECVEGRRVFLFQARRGPDRKLGSAPNKKLGEDADPADLDRWFSWGLRAPVDGRVYARVSPKMGDGFVCRADRSRTIKTGPDGIPHPWL
jgi:hypothetical protein